MPTKAKIDVRLAMAEEAYERKMKRARLKPDHPKYLPYSRAVKLAMRAYDAAKNGPSK